MRNVVRMSLITTILMGVTSTAMAQSPFLFGTLASKPHRATQIAEHGMTIATYCVSWDQFEPTQGQFNAAYIDTVKADLQTFRDAGLHISLDVGMQYPPTWTYQLSHAVFVNQYGDTFDYAHKPGTNGLNAVFNQAIRDAQATYLAKIFEVLGNDFFAVRLGWGYYGELNYPHPENRGKKNSYWAFDPIAQGKIKGLPDTLSPCPVPGWIPGTSSPNHDSARLFANWYLDALKDYHDWQITTTRKHFESDIVMMVGSWGMRDGDLQKHIAIDLADDKRTEIQRGFDYPRFIAGVTDPKYIVYGTWLDTPAKFSDDASDNPARWSPIHYLSHAAKQHPLKLRVWAENTGPGSLAEMKLSFERAKAFDVQAIVWAFEDDLFTGKHATLAQYQQLIKEYTTSANTTKN